MNAATTLTGGKHGSKWIGGITMASAVLAGVDPSTLPPSWLPWITAISGALMLVRGSINTANINAQSQPPTR
jgi:hypothetical protein